MGAAIIDAYVSGNNIHHEQFTSLHQLFVCESTDICNEIWKVWLIAFLMEHNLIILPENIRFNEIVRNAITRSRSYCYYSPVKITQDLLIYPFGIVALKALKRLDGIPFYSLVEQIVLFMRDCEYFLTTNIPHIHNTMEIRVSILHSTLRFLQLAECQKVYTWKAHQLQQLITFMHHDKEVSRPVDNYILEYLCGVKNSGKFWNENELGYIGAIAFLYDLPGLFAEVFRPIDINHYEVPNLVGVGLGILSNLIYGIEL